MKKRGAESAFEATKFANQQLLVEQGIAGSHRESLPIYSFATLSIVGNENERPQSGFCTYFLDLDQRVADRSWQEERRSELLTPSGNDVRMSLVSVLCAVHFLESERQGSKDFFLPVLDPFKWVEPLSQAGAGEAEIMCATKKAGAVLLNLHSVLNHITEILELQRLGEPA